jgi:hypothetical protein
VQKEQARGHNRQAGHLKRKAMECKKTGKGKVINKSSGKNKQNGGIKNIKKKQAGGENRQASSFQKYRQGAVKRREGGIKKQAGGINESGK